MSNAHFRFDNAKRNRPEHHARQAMLTPAYVLESVRSVPGGIGRDPCTEPDDPTRADRFYCLPDDGCVLPWDAPSVFCNPPHGTVRTRWIKRCIAKGRYREVVLLMPSQEFVLNARTLVADCSCCVPGTVPDNRRN